MPFFSVWAAAVVTLDHDAHCTHAALAFNGIAATPVSVPGLAPALAGRFPDDGAIAAAVAANLSVADPLGDVQASGEYRVELARVYGRRALEKYLDHMAAIIKAART